MYVLCANMTKKNPKGTFMTDQKLLYMMLLGDLIVNLNHLKRNFL